MRWPKGLAPDLDHWLGDSLTATIPRVVPSVFDGDLGPLIATIEERGADSCVRWGLFEVLAQLTVRGLAPRNVTIEMIDRFERDRLAEDGDFAWDGWRIAVMALRLPGCLDRIRAARKAGRFDRPRRLPSAPFLHRRIGQNEPCPCGSGKKYKRCCGAE